MRWFGREPVYILAFVSVALKLLAAYGVNVTDAQQGAIMAFLSLIVAAVSAIVLKTGALGAAIINLAQGALALFLAFGLDMPAETQAAWMLIVESGVALWLHERVTAPVALVGIEQKSLAVFSKTA